MSEVWKDITGYEGMYQVSNLGNIKGIMRLVDAGNNRTRIAKGIQLQPIESKKGYLSVSLCKDGKGKPYRIHRLVAMEFIQNTKPNVFDQVNHKDGNKKNNMANNLEWVDNSINQIHRHKILGQAVANKGVYNLKKFLPKEVLQISSDGRVLKIFPSLAETKRQGFEPRNIFQCIKGKRQSHKGYKWQYKTNVL